MRIPSLRNNLTACLLLCTTGGLIAAEDAVAKPATLPSPTSEQVAPPPAVLPQDVPQIEIPSPTSTPLSPADQEFLTKALGVVTAERELGKLASERGETEEVKALGRELLTSQVKNGAALQELAKLKNFQLKMPLDDPHEEILAPLQEKSGPAFDTAFRESVAQDRSRSIQLFAIGAKTAKDPAVRGLAMQALAELKKERPLAAAEAAKTVESSREISKVALSSQPEKPAAKQTAEKTAVPSVATATPTVPVTPLPPATAAAPANPASITATTSEPISAPATAAPQVPAPAYVRPVRSQISDETGVVYQSAPSRAAIPATNPAVGSAPANLPQAVDGRAITVPTSTAVPVQSAPVRSMPPTRSLSPSAIQTFSPPPVETAPVVTSPARTHPSVAGENVRYSTPSPVLEGPATTSKTRAAVRVQQPARPAIVDAAQTGEEQPAPRKRGPVVTEEAPRPRVIRRPTEAVVEGNPPPSVPERKVIRRKLFQFSKDDENDDD